MTDAVALFLLLVGVAVFIEIRRRAALPTRVARRRLDSLIAELLQQLSALGAPNHNFADEQEALARRQWIEDQMDGTPIEAIKAPGTGPSAHEALRASGISSLRDLSKLQQDGVKVPDIGPTKTHSLVTAYHAERRRLIDEAGKLDRTALDRAHKGRLSRVIERHDAAELERTREVESLRVRLDELESRRTRLAAFKH